MCKTQIDQWAPPERAASSKSYCFMYKERPHAWRHKDFYAKKLDDIAAAALSYQLTM
jgi:hypothetical protein